MQGGGHLITMSVNYAVKKCKNPNGVEGVNYYSCRAIKANDYDFEELAKDISLATTVTKPDAQAVLGVIKLFITKALLAGRRVVLPELGAFQIGINGKCYPAIALEDKEFSPSSMIKGHRVHFRINPQLKKEVAMGFQLKRVSSEWME